MITPPQSPLLGSAGGDERVVRFDSECVLIPESVLCYKRPKVFTKSYSLPLWKRKAPLSTGVSDAELGANEENQLVLKVPVPRYVLVAKFYFKADLTAASCPNHHGHRREPLKPNLYRHVWSTQNQSLLLVLLHLVGSPSQYRPEQTS
jgi:hypothetical protein